MIHEVEGTYVVPRGSGEGAPLVLDIKKVVTAETRLQEVAFVNVDKAPELLSFYNENWLTLHRAVTALTYERNVADDACKTAYAEALLDVNDEALKRRGHAKGSADLRDAVALLDDRVRKSRERLNEIKAVLEYVSGKRQAFENAYNSVKKLVGDGKLPEGTLHAPQPQRQQEQRVNTTKIEDEDDFPGFVAPKGFRI